MTFRELGDRMDADEFLEWQAFDETHISEAWYQNALLRLTVAQLAGGKSLRLEDFLPRRAKPDRPRQADPFGVFMGWATRHNQRIGAPPPEEV